MRIFSATAGWRAWEGAEHAHELFDFPLVQQALLVNLDPGLQLRGVMRVELACQLPQMLTSVVKIDNVKGAGKMQKASLQIHSAPSPITTCRSARFQPRFQASP